MVWCVYTIYTTSQRTGTEINFRFSLGIYRFRTSFFSNTHTHQTKHTAQRKVYIFNSHLNLDKLMLFFNIPECSCAIRSSDAYMQCTLCTLLKITQANGQE